MRDINSHFSRLMMTGPDHKLYWRLPNRNQGEVWRLAHLWPGDVRGREDQSKTQVVEGLAQYWPGNVDEDLLLLKTNQGGDPLKKPWWRPAQQGGSLACDIVVTCTCSDDIMSCQPQPDTQEHHPRICQVRQTCLPCTPSPFNFFQPYNDPARCQEALHLPAWW